MNRKTVFLTTAMIITAHLSPVSAKVLKVPSQYKTVQSAIDAAQSYDTVEVAPGTYLEQLELKAWVTVRSEGTEAEHKDHTAARRTIINANNEPKPVVEGADGAVVDGFTLTGMGKVNHHLPGHPHAVQCRGASPIIINNIIHHNGSTGIGSHVKNGRPAAPWIENNIVYSNFGLGIGSNHDSAATIIGNTVFNNDEVGIGVRNGAHSLVINNKVYDNNWTGIGAKDGGFPSIVRNIVHHNGKRKIIDRAAGIGIKRAFVPIVEENTSYSNYTAGIGLSLGSSATVRNNDVFQNGYSGVALDGAKNVFIEGNEVHQNNKAGIGMTNGSSAVIRGNHIYGNVNAGVSPRTEENVVMENNNLHDNGEPYSGAPPEIVRSDYNPMTGESGNKANPAPPGLPGASFYDWVKQPQKK